MSYENLGNSAYWLEQQEKKNKPEKDRRIDERRNNWEIITFGQEVGSKEGRKLK